MIKLNRTNQISTKVKQFMFFFLILFYFLIYIKIIIKLLIIINYTLN